MDLSVGIKNDLFRLSDICKLRLASYFRQPRQDKVLRIVKESEWSAEFKNTIDLSDDEYIAFLMALAPHVFPSFFEKLIQEFLPDGGDFSEFGGVKGSNHRGVLPTGETVQFILAGDDLEKRLKVQEIFRENGNLFSQNILWLESVREGEPMMSGRLIMAEEWIEKVLFGRDYAPRFGLDFPARKISTKMTWDDVVLHPRTQQQIKHISIWLEHHKTMMADSNLQRRVKPGYRVLFYGPPGTGKTLTTALLGKQFNKDVYRIDLSQIISKFIGETEKNLENVFRRAENRDWILFFDEADALFGKRTSVQSSHDKYANQEVSYLLQRVEDFPGLLILASNFKSNLDDAFIRRFHEVVHFPLPDAGERKILWEKSLPAGLKPESVIDLTEIASLYELTGASILSAVQYAALCSYAKNSKELTNNDLIEGIRREFLKEEKSI
jgi:AAA+ superfamily predicted ATPase